MGEKDDDNERLRIFDPRPLHGLGGSCKVYHNIGSSPRSISAVRL